MNRVSIRTVAVAVLVFLLVTACGGGGHHGGMGGGSTPAVSMGVMSKGSVIVNGVRFDDTTASIAIDDTPKTAADLRDGMVVKVLGTVNNDGINGTAQRVKAKVETRGGVTAVHASENPQRLEMQGQDVIVDDLTVYSGVANFGAITPTTLVEVYGPRDASGRVRASRIEANSTQMGDASVDEIRGVVSGGTGTNPTTFNLGLQAINASGAVIAPVGASYQNGSVVEVHCSARPNCTPGGVFQAARIAVEDVEDADFQPSVGQRFEAEGLISGFTTHPGNFSVAGTPVTTTGSTVFKGGIATDLANDIKVEAEGAWNGTRLVATQIEFKRSVVRLQGTVTVSGSSTFTMNVAGHGVSIETDSFTNGAVPPVGPNCVQVRGQRKAGGGVVVTAGEISSSCSNGNRPVMQAAVEAESPESTITLLGFVLDVSNPTDTPPQQWVDVNNQPLSRAALFNAVVPASPGPPAVAGTLVKVIFDSGANTVRQVELED